MSLSALSGPYLSSNSSGALLDSSDIETFLQDLVRRFEPDNESEECADAMERDIMNVREMERDQGTSPAFTLTPPSARVPAHTSSPSPPPSS